MVVGESQQVSTKKRERERLLLKSSSRNKTGQGRTMEIISLSFPTPGLSRRGEERGRSINVTAGEGDHG